MMFRLCQMRSDNHRLKAFHWKFIGMKSIEKFILIEFARNLAREFRSDFHLFEEHLFGTFCNINS